MLLRACRKADMPALAALWERAVRVTHTFLTEQDIHALRGEVETVYLKAMNEIWLIEISAEENPTAEISAPERRKDESSAEGRRKDASRKNGAPLPVPAGFLGMVGDKVEMLFVDPVWRGHGVGTLLLNHARTRHPALTVDVNEQNPAAHGFYLHYGFRDVGREDTDGAGRPFPLVHMAL